MTRALETFAGIAFLFAVLTAVDCLPGMTKMPQRHPVFGDAGIPACAPEAAPALLCDRVTKTTPPRECAICPDPARHCVTPTAVYCATSCDEPLCDKRK